MGDRFNVPKRRREYRVRWWCPKDLAEDKPDETWEPEVAHTSELTSNLFHGASLHRLWLRKRRERLHAEIVEAVAIAEMIGHVSVLHCVSIFLALLLHLCQTNLEGSRDLLEEYKASKEKAKPKSNESDSSDKPMAEAGEEGEEAMMQRMEEMAAEAKERKAAASAASAKAPAPQKAGRIGKK